MPISLFIVLDDISFAIMRMLFAVFTEINACFASLRMMSISFLTTSIMVVFVYYQKSALRKKIFNIFYGVSDLSNFSLTFAGKFYSKSQTIGYSKNKIFIGRII